MLVRFVAGLLVGGTVAAAAFFALGLGDTSSDTAAAPSTVPGVVTTAGSVATTTTTTEVPWVDAGEARFESTLVLPTGLWVDGGVATLEYELASLGPMRPSYFFEYGMEPGWHGEYGPVAALPEHWVLVVGDDTVEGQPSVTSRAVRFAVPDEASLDDVVEVRLTGWRVAMPMHHEFEITLASGETVLLPDGASVEVRQVLEQENGTILQFRAYRPQGDDFAGRPVADYITPMTDQWVLSPAGEQGDGFQLASTSTEAPDSLVLRYTRPMWWPITGDVVVWAGEGT